MSFLDNYEPVDIRVAKFWADHPTGRIHTSLVDSSPDMFVFRSEVFREATDEWPMATGYAHEVRTEKGVNSTSALENCETSAIGRALANAGYAAKGARPSREEMTKTQHAQPVATDDIETMAPSAIAAELRARGLEPGGTVPEMRDRLRKALAGVS